MGREIGTSSLRKKTIGYRYFETIEELPIAPIIDLITGAFWAYPDSVYAKLAKTGMGQSYITDMNTKPVP